MTESLVVKFKKIHPDALMPEYKTAGAAGFDLALVEDVTLAPRTFQKVGTGIVAQVPPGYFLLLSSRSSNPGKKGITLINGIGVIDSDYCGPTDEIMLLVENVTDAEVHLKKGDRVSQCVLLPSPQARFEEILGDVTAPDRGGFGSTG